MGGTLTDFVGRLQGADRTKVVTALVSVNTCFKLNTAVPRIRVGKPSDC